MRRMERMAGRNSLNAGWICWRKLLQCCDNLASRRRLNGLARDAPGTYSRNLFSSSGSGSEQASDLLIKR